MGWLRLKRREWLGINSDFDYLNARIDVIRHSGLEDNERLKSLESQLSELKEALKRKAAQPVRSVYIATDYETAQVKALDEFKEK